MKLPTEGEITALRVNLLEKKISVHTGELVDGEAIYKDFRELSCRTKLVARVDATLIHHPLVYYGDIREKVKDVARLVGFQVVEEDKLREERGR